MSSLSHAAMDSLNSLEIIGRGNERAFRTYSIRFFPLIVLRAFPKGVASSSVITMYSFSISSCHAASISGDGCPKYCGEEGLISR